MYTRHILELYLHFCACPPIDGEQFAMGNYRQRYARVRMQSGANRARLCLLCYYNCTEGELVRLFIED